MLYMVQSRPSMQRANTIDAGEGPGPVFAKIAERFKPETIYGSPAQRDRKSTRLNSSHRH